MTNQQHPDLFDWATELLDAQGHVTLSEQEAHEIGARLRRLHSENETLQAGYAAARLEIESPQARIKTMTEEQAELRRLSGCCPELNLSNYGPDDVDELNGWAIEVSQCIDRALAAQPAVAQQPEAAYAAQRASIPCGPLIDNFPPRPEPAIWHEGGGFYNIYQLELFANATHALRASNGQAPAQAAPDVSGYVSEWSGGLCTSDEAMDGIAKMYAAQPAGAQQPGTAYAALRPDAVAVLKLALEYWEHRQQRYKNRSPAWVIAAREVIRASHGQTPAQAAPAYKDSTPELHVGDSAFESWYSNYSPAHKGDKQRARDAYAAGMGDPLVTAAPQQEAQEPYSIDADPQGIRARVADAITGALAFGAQGANPPPTGHWLVPFWETAREEASRNRPVSSDTLYLLRRLLSNQHTLTGSEFREELTKIVGEATQAADSVLEDAARWKMAVLVGDEVMLHPEKRTHPAAVKAYMDAVHSGLDLTGAIDAARKQGANHD